MRKILALGCVAALAGCAGGGPSGGDLTKSSMRAGAGRVVVYRTSPYGLAVQPPVLVDGRPIGNNQPGGFVSCDLAAGAHTIKIDNVAFYAALGDGTEMTTVAVKPGSTAYFVANPNALGFTNLAPVSEAQGRGDTASMSQVASKC